jgi:hypothetical protein
VINSHYFTKPQKGMNIVNNWHIRNCSKGAFTYGLKTPRRMEHNPVTTAQNMITNPSWENPEAQNPTKDAERTPKAKKVLLIILIQKLLLEYGNEKPMKRTGNIIMYFQFQDPSFSAITFADNARMNEERYRLIHRYPLFPNLVPPTQ